MNPIELRESLSALRSGQLARHSASLVREVEPYVPRAEIVGDIAVIWMQGILTKHDRYGWGTADTAVLESQVIALMGRPDISTVVTSGHSPGGDAVAAMDAAALIAELGQSKRTVFYVNNCACSAMYWIAAAHGEIYSTPGGVSGNIGTKLAFVDQSEAWAQEGLKKELFTTGDLKSTGEPGLSLTDEQRTFLEAHVEELAVPFRDFVAARRDVDDEVWRGGWYSAERAQSLGLIDGVHLTLAHLVASLIDS